MTTHNRRYFVRRFIERMGNLTVRKKKLQFMVENAQELRGGKRLILDESIFALKLGIIVEEQDAMKLSRESVRNEMIVEYELIPEKVDGMLDRHWANVSRIIGPDKPENYYVCEVIVCELDYLELEELPCEYYFERFVEEVDEVDEVEEDYDWKEWN